MQKKFIYTTLILLVLIFIGSSIRSESNARGVPNLMKQNINAIIPLSRSTTHDCMWGCLLYQNEDCYLCNPCGDHVPNSIMPVIRSCKSEPE